MTIPIFNFLHYSAPTGCGNFDQGIYTHQEIDIKITMEGYVPIANVNELLLARNNDSNETMGLGTCWEAVYPTIGHSTKYILLRNLDVSATTWTVSIGRQNDAHFDGSGLTIDGLNGTRGLIAGNSTSTYFDVKNLNLINVDIDAGSSQYVGALTTRHAGGDVENNYVSGSVVTTGLNCAGVVGYDAVLAKTLNIIDCHFNGTVTSTGISGGMTSWVRPSATFPCNITGCKVEGSINGGGTGSGPMVGHGANYTNITFCQSTATVIATGIQAGGMAGRLDAPSTVDDCRYEGFLSSAGRTGGMVGSSSGTIDINRCIAIATYGGSTSFRGGIKGRYGANITDCVWEKDLSGVTITSGTMIGTTGGYSVSDLQTPTSATGIYASWGVEWDFGASNEYPALI